MTLQLYVGTLKKKYLKGMLSDITEGISIIFIMLSYIFQITYHKK